jgi:D-alanyl-D-alanine carboxypeptidase (penicillin-binding protein 5/6)
VLAEHAAKARAGGHESPEAKAEDLVAAFVARMNRRAQELGMASTRYASPNGLPPPRGAKRGFDVSTAQDLAKLGRPPVAMPEALTYTSRASHTVTGGGGQPSSFQNHNYFVPRNRDPQHLATPMPECDGLKTGYTAASGSSIVLTAARNGRRVVVVVLGSAGRHEREAAAGRLLRDALDAVSIW